jgi:formate hydrogenlyase subunit 6/NADH:ubiquinone oxidoreductase subunit I
LTRWMKSRDIREAVRSLFSMPVTEGFPKTRFRPVDGSRGKPQFDETGCVACGSCARVCPSGAIRVHDPKPGAPGRKIRAVRRMEVRYDACHFCGLCEERCITGRGIRLTREFDLALIDRTLASESIEKEMVFCEGCGRAVTSAAHLVWIAGRLGEMASANPALIRILQDPRVTIHASPPGTPPDRSDDAKILCPDCRRNVRLSDGRGLSPPSSMSQTR